MNKAVVFLGMVYPDGIVRYFAEVGVAINNQMKDCDFDFYYAALTKENHVGAWDRVRSTFSIDRIICGETFSELIANVMHLLDVYETVVFDIGGGWYQMRKVIPYKKKYRNRLRLIVTTHSYAHGTWKEFPMSLMQCYLYLRYVDKVIFQCPYAAQHFAGSSWLFRSGKGVIMPLGVLPAQMCGETMPEVLREKGLDDVLNDEHLFKLIYLAEFRSVKNHVWLTRALMPVVKEFPQLHVLYCGGDSSSLAQDVRQMVKDAGLDKQFHIPGVIPRFAIPWLLNHCSCAIVASVSETFGQVYTEALMYGIPVIGTRVGAGEYVMQDYATGFGFNLNSPKELQERVRFMLTHRESVKTMGENGKRIAESMYSMCTIVQSRIDLYKSMFGKNERATM